MMIHNEVNHPKKNENTVNMHEQRLAAIGYRIGMLHRLYRLCTDSLVSKIGISFTLVPYLGELYHHDGITQDALALRVCMDKGSTARAVRKLEQLGFIRRIENYANRRQKIIYITDKGNRLRDAFFAPLYGISALMSESFSEHERQTMLSFFDVMMKKLQHELERQKQINGHANEHEGVGDESHLVEHY